MLLLTVLADGDCPRPHAQALWESRNYGAGSGGLHPPTLMPTSGDGNRRRSGAGGNDSWGQLLNLAPEEE